MTIVASSEQLAQGYEALRAQSLGQLPDHTPRGMALLRNGGVVAWMCACPPLPNLMTAIVVRPPDADHAPAAVSRELVHLLTEMALGSQRRWSTT